MSANPEYVIIYDRTLDDGHVQKQGLFFGFDGGRACVLENGPGVKVYQEYAHALGALPLARKVGKPFVAVSLPRVVMVKHG